MAAVEANTSITIAVHAADMASKQMMMATWLLAEAAADLVKLVRHLSPALPVAVRDIATKIFVFICVKCNRLRIYIRARNCRTEPENVISKDS